MHRGCAESEGGPTNASRARRLPSAPTALVGAAVGRVEQSDVRCLAGERYLNDVAPVTLPEIVFDVLHQPAPFSEREVVGSPWTDPLLT